MKKRVLMLLFLLFVLSVSVFLGTIKAATQIDLYAGEVSSSSYGFGNTASSITSNPGPPMTFTSGQSYTVILHNVSTQGQSHNWAISDTKSSTGTVQWGAIIGSSSNPVSPGSSSSVTFTAGSPGNYYYVCQVDGHIGLGMWGNVVVQSAVPEFPATLVVALFAFAMMTLAVYLGRINIKVTRKF
jgi:plastocyanin